MEDFDFASNEENKRTVELKNGNKLHFKRSDPYGFWTVNYDKGQLPAHLLGQYTSYDRAEAAVKTYLNELGKEPAKADAKGTVKNAA
jgi:hypothetical protein